MEQRFHTWNIYTKSPRVPEITSAIASVNGTFKRQTQ
jgi:hypothetical protein